MKLKRLLNPIYILELSPIPPLHLGFLRVGSSKFDCASPKRSVYYAYIYI